MEIIYLDLHFLVNLMADYLVALASARVCGLKLKRLRYLFSALLGALYSVLSLLPGLELLSAPLSKLLTGVLMAIIAFGCEKEPLRCGGVFLGVSALFGGLTAALGGSLPLLEFMVCFALCYGALSLFFKGRAALPDKKRVSVSLELSGQRAEFMALVDTGNSLSDPVSGCSAMIACPHAVRALFRENSSLLELEPAELLEISSHIPELRGRFRLLPYSAVGSKGMLAAFRADRALVDGKEESLLVALSKAAAGDGFEAII